MRHSTNSLVLAALLSAAALAACSDDSGRAGPPAPPPGGANDPAYTIVAAPKYILAGDALTPDSAAFTVTVKPPAGAAPDLALEAWVDGDGPVRLAAVADGSYTGSYDRAASLAFGAHTLLLADAAAPAAFAQVDFVKGHAYYVVVSNDWDNSYNTPVQLDLQQALHIHHPHLVLTHLVGPYTFTDPVLQDSQRAAMVTWVKSMRDNYGDEIGTHIHPYCNFVEAAGLPCATTPSFRSADPDPTGYTVELGAYTYEQWMTMFAKVDELWAANGFAKPTSFRAGGWSLELPALRALADSGYVADSSAVNWARMEEWATEPGATLYQWNMAQWAPIGNTTQAYYATEDSILPGGSGATIPVLEVTDNGILADYVLAPEMIEIFHDNWDGKALEAPVELSIGYHPPSIDYDDGRGRFFERVDDALTHIDGFLATDAQGPVVYITMSQAATVWPPR
jgi:hypothetical protein